MWSKQGWANTHSTHIYVDLHISAVWLQYGGVSVSVITWLLSFREQRRSCTHPAASWGRSSLRSTVNLSCTTHTPTSSAPPSPANTATSWESPAPARNTGQLQTHRVWGGNKVGCIDTAGKSGPNVCCCWFFCSNEFFSCQCEQHNHMESDLF